MAIINFPSNPLTGTIYTFEDRSWIWNGRAWQTKSVFVGYTGSQGYTGSSGAGYTGSAGQDGTSVSIIGSTSTFSTLPDPYMGNVGDGYITQDNGHLNVYTGSDWNDVGQIIGYTGSAGSAGDVGYTGSAGAGYTGSAGADGYTGSAGDVGYTGSAGGFTGTTELAIVTTNTTESTSTETGALIVAGGAGIDGNIHFSGNLYKNGVLFTGGGGGDNTPNAINLFQSGLLTINPGTTRWYAPYSLVITSIKARVVVVADSDIVISINKNNTSEETITILANAVDAATVTSEIYLDYADFLTVAITQVGSASQPGADLYVQFMYQYLPA